MRARPLTLAALLLLSLGLAPRGASGGDAPKKPHHPREVSAPDETPTRAWRQDPPGTVPERGDTAVLTLLQDIDSLNPYTATSAEASYLHDLIWPRIVEEQPDYYAGPPTFKPNLATAWTFGADKRSIRFTLREATWSDGHPLTAEDVRFSWEAARHPKVAWASASIVDFITDVEVHSPRELTVHYAESYPYQLMDIADVHILPQHVFGKVPFDGWQNHGPWDEQAKVTGGPWVLEKAVPNQQFIFGRNPRYWDAGKPYLDRVVFRIVQSMETNLNALLAGDVDYMQRVLPKDTERVLADERLLLYAYQDRVIIWVGWNSKRAPFDDPRVRRALSMAVDREDIVESVLYGQAAVAGPVINHSMWASNHAVKPIEFDPGAAEVLLEEAGWKKGADGVRAKDGKRLAFAIVTNAGNEVRKRICEMAQAKWKDVGAQAEIRLQDFNQMTVQLKKHDFDAFLGGMSFATKMDGTPIFHSKAAASGFNYPAYANARVDEIIEKARVMSDQAAAKPLWDELQTILADEQPWSPLYEPRGLVGLSKRFRNVQVTSLRPTQNLHEWWVPKAEQKFH